MAETNNKFSDCEPFWINVIEEELDNENNVSNKINSNKLVENYVIKGKSVRQTTKIVPSVDEKNTFIV